MNRRSLIRGVAVAGIPLLAGCGDLEGVFGDGGTQSTPTQIDDSPAILVENQLDRTQLVTVHIRENEQDPPIIQFEVEVNSSEREYERLELSEGDYIVRAEMEGNSIDTLFGDEWSLESAETLLITLAESEIHFEEL